MWACFWTKWTLLFIHPTENSKGLEARLRWLNTVSVRDVCWCNSAHAKGLQKTNMPSIDRSLFTQHPHYQCYFSLQLNTQCIDGFSLLLQRCVRKGNNANNPAILCFTLLPKEPSQMQRIRSCSKIWDDCFSRNLPISNSPVVRISRNLAKQ